MSTWGQCERGSRRVSLWIPCLHKLRALGVGVIGGQNWKPLKSWLGTPGKGRLLGDPLGEACSCPMVIMEPPALVPFLGGRGQLHLLLFLSAGSSFTAHAQSIFWGIRSTEEAKRLSGLSVVSMVCKTQLPCVYKSKVVEPLPHSFSAEK